ncbi:MAG TPA: tetratricopeptide repeat protein [Chitinophagaceae bacterium]|jgi:tetratricopeptide (TPR) repeat protein|nr:tetratricopeptide repeat protein [Chitinophagaceae bacterium]
MMDVSVMLEKAELLLRQGRTRDAEAALHDVLAKEPDHDEAIALLARCAFDKGELEKGSGLIEEAIRLDPNNSYYFYLQGFAYYRRDLGSAAVGSLNKAIALNPYVAEYFGMLAHIRIAEKAFEEGLDNANQGLALESDNLTCLNARSIALNKLKRTEAAIATMQNALALDPDNEMTHTTVGWNHLEKGRHKEARRHFLEALRINPNGEAAREGLKAALKSTVAPYRWLLQYSFWIQDKGKNMRVIVPLVLFLSFRVLISVFQNNQGTENLAWILAAVYLLFMVTSWTINSIANFFLLFHPMGRYALSAQEKRSAVMVVTALVTGLAVMGISEGTSLAAGTPYQYNLFTAGLVLLSLALPLGDWPVPFQWNGMHWRAKFGVALTLLGVAALAMFAVSPGIIGLLAAYGIAFLVYNWSALAR